MKKVALVTGSGKKRVGATIATELATRGYAVAIHYRSSATEAEQLRATLHAQGAEVATFPADLTDETQVQDLVASVRARFGSLDVFVQAAAVWGRKKLEDITAADVRLQWETNTLATFLCCQHVGLAMVQQPEGGTIITIGDWAEARPYLDHAAYFASKGAIPTMTRCFAHELGARNPRVRVNCILPGPVMLPSDLPEAEKQQAIAATLVKREGRPENIALAVLALAENDFITGACLPVDGGRTVYAPE